MFGWGSVAERAKPRVASSTCCEFFLGGASERWAHGGESNIQFGNCEQDSHTMYRYKKATHRVGDGVADTGDGDVATHGDARHPAIEHAALRHGSVRCP